MQFLKKHPNTLHLAILLTCLLTLASTYELTLTNRATFPTDATFFFDKQLIWESEATFYLVEIYNSSSRNLIAIDQTNNNNISNLASLPIDNLNPSTFFLAFTMNTYLGFIYDLQSENGVMGTLLIVEKTNFSSTYISSLYASYVSAIFVNSRSAILAVSTYNQVNMIINPEGVNVSTISGPFLVNDWAIFTDTELSKSINQNYLLVFSLLNEVFELLSVSNSLTGLDSLTIIPQNLTSVSSVCFIQETSVAVRQNTTLSFYSLPAFQLVSQEQISLGSSSDCYLDTITGELIFVYQDNNETVFWSYNMSSATEVNTTIVTTTSQVIFTNSKIYIISSADPNAVSFSFFDYQSCHRNYDYDIAQFRCYECPSGCNSCNSSEFCYSDCLSGSYFIDDFCCGNSQYYQIVSAQKHCYNCPTGCYNCTSSQICLTCRANNYFIDDYCCGNSQYYLVANSTKRCYNCPTGCYNCTSSQVCLTCRANNYFIDDYCCGNSQYYIIANSSKGCLACPSGCYNCSSSQYCYSCTTGNILVNNYCCAANKYLSVTGNGKSCLACPSGCYNCSNTTYCYSCTTGNTLINNYCCGASKYLSTTAGAKSCLACPTGCTNCSSSQYCYSCTAGKVLIDNYCCTASQYIAIPGGMKSCLACPSGCSNCSNATFCYTCAAGKIFANNFCCSAGQYSETIGEVASCFACSVGCAMCTEFSYCLSCNSTWLIGIDGYCYNSTEFMPTGEEGNLATIAAKRMTKNGFVSFFNSIPSLRGFLKPIFGSFAWFDELYLFQFHERDYGINMQLLFTQIQTIQQQKWAGAGWLITDRILALFSTSIANATKSIDHKAKYSSSFWTNRAHNGQGFLVNTLSYFVTVIILTLALYLLARFAFFLMFKQRWSMILRSFSFWPYLIVLLMEGNLLQLIFFACADFRLAFSLAFSQKARNIFTWFCFFAFVLISTALFPLIYSAYGKRTRYFTYNMHLPFNNLAVVYLAVELGFKQLLQGMLHYFLKDSPYYQLQLALLMTVQGVACIGYIFFILKGCFNYKFKVWLSVLQSFAKMALLGFLLLRMQYLDVDQLNAKTNKILGYVTALYLILIYVNLGVSCLILIREAVVNLRRRMEKDEEERLKELADAREKVQEEAGKEKMRVAAQQAYSNLKTHKTTMNQDRSIFFRHDKPKPVNTDIVRVVRVKRDPKEGIN